MVAPDGTLLVGPRLSATGLISRRSELRTLRQQVADLAAKIERGRGEVAVVEEQISAQRTSKSSRLAAEQRELAGRLAEQRLASGAAEERHMQLERQPPSIEAELTAAAAEHQTASQSLAATRMQAERNGNGRCSSSKPGLREGVARAAELDQSRQRASRETNAARVELAKSEQQVEHLQTQKGQLERDQQERGRALAESRHSSSAGRAVHAAGRPQHPDGRIGGG